MSSDISKTDFSGVCVSGGYFNGGSSTCRSRSHERGIWKHHAGTVGKDRNRLLWPALGCRKMQVWHGDPNQCWWGHDGRWVTCALFLPIDSLHKKSQGRLNFINFWKKVSKIVFYSYTSPFPLVLSVQLSKLLLLTCWLTSSKIVRVVGEPIVVSVIFYFRRRYRHVLWSCW